jgi:site-specific DNA-adenine methylase
MPFFTFFGGKWRVAPRYPAPQHSLVIEPFAGSAGYSLRYPERSVRLYDLDPIIVAVWDYLIHVPQAEIMRLPLNVTHVDELAVCQEARWLIGFWLNKGMNAPCKSPSAWMREGLRPKSYWGPETQLRIATQVDSIHHWSVTEASYETIVPARATWFIDPPYKATGNKYRFHWVDYEHLAAWCRGLPGQVLVCESVGADWLPFEFLVNAKANDSATGGKRSLEAVWVQGVPWESVPLWVNA